MLTPVPTHPIHQTHEYSHSSPSGKKISARHYPYRRPIGHLNTDVLVLSGETLPTSRKWLSENTPPFPTKRDFVVRRTPQGRKQIEVLGLRVLLPKGSNAATVERVCDFFSRS